MIKEVAEKASFFYFKKIWKYEIVIYIFVIVKFIFYIIKFNLPMKLFQVLLVLTILCAIYSGNLSAQNVSISGRVTATDNQPIEGASVRLKQSSVGVTADNNGNFKISVPNAKGVLIFSYVGHSEQEVAINNRSVINVSLKEGDKQLDDVVVMGYGTRRKSDLTGSVSQVKAKEINAYPTTNVLQALSGRAPGVQVLQNTGSPGASVSVRIGGTNSIQGSNEPLYVVDGFPISGSNPTVINNADIESIEILKDASATAIYGSRGANGVVLITTKRGKAGKTQVDFESSYSTQTLRKKLELMNAKEYATFYNEQAKNDNVLLHTLPRRRLMLLMKASTGRILYLLKRR